MSRSLLGLALACFMVLLDTAVLAVAVCALAALVLMRSHDSSSSAAEGAVDDVSVPTCASVNGDKRAFS
ncbi:hypothetical protein ABH931_000738 [Streptacidiphilus sp. MAP12-33]|uniref:hypothetical protein n=1 Tax=Streptacidiphilus sp. MAP12-33 TaxID=3156266 RepID=UPI003514D0F0